MDEFAVPGMDRGKALADLASEPLIVADGGRITYSNSAARSLFAGSCAARPLEGASLDTLCNPCPTKAADAPRRVMGHLLDGKTKHLVAWTVPGGTDGELLLRLREVDGDGQSPELPEILRVLADNATDALMIVDVQTLRYLYLNDAAVHLMRPLSRAQIDGFGADGVRQHFGQNEDLRASYAELVAQSPVQIAREVKLPAGNDERTRTLRFMRRALKVQGRWIIVVNGRETTDDLHQQERLERLLSGIDVSDDGLFLIDRSTMRYLDVNEAACRLLGCSREQLMRRTANQTSRSLGSVEQLAAVYDDVIANAPATQIAEVPVERADGSTIICEARRKPVRQGDRWIIAATLRDITERKRTQVRMERFATALDLSGDGVFLIDRASMRYVDVNQAACSLLGYSREELLRRKPHEAPLRRYREAEMATEYDRVIAHAPSTLTQEVDLVREDGSVVICEVRRQAIRSESGWLIVANCRDITERKAAQARTELLGSAMNASSDYILLIDRERMAYIDANEAALRLFGMRREEFLRAKPWEISRYLVTREELEKDFDGLIASSPEPDSHLRVVRDSGGVVTEAYDARRQALLIGERWVILTAARNVTEQLRERSRMELFANVLNLSADATAVIDRASMSYVDVNPAACELLGQSRDEIVGRTLRLGAGESLEDVGLAYDKLIKDAPAADEREVTYLRADGKITVLSARQQAILLDGRWLIVVSGRDVTDRKAAQSRAQLLAIAMNTSADRVYFVDRERMEYIDANDGALKHQGVATVDELRSIEPWAGNRYPIARAKLEESYDQVIAHAPEHCRTMEVWRDPDGTVAGAAEITRTALRIDGRWAIVVTWHDMTEHLRQRARIERFATALDLSADGVFLVDRESMKLLDVNQTVCDLLGTTREELLNRPIDLFSSELGRRQDLAAAYDQAIAQSPLPHVTELSLRRADGSVVPCEVRRQAIRSNDRWVIVATARDITERKKALARMELFTSAINLSTDGIYFIDRASMTYVDVNDAGCALVGLSREEVLSRRPGQIAAPASLEQVAAEYDELISRAPAMDAREAEYRLAGGALIRVEIRRQAIHSDGRWLICVNMRDITERKAAQARNELLAAAMNNSSDYIVIIDPQTKIVVDCNEAVLRFHGLQRAEVLGMPSTFATPQFSPDDLGDRYQAVIDIWPESQRTVHSVTGLRTGVTDLFDVRRQALQAGDSWLIVATAQNVTERQEHLARIERLAAAMEMSEDAVTMLEGESRRLLYANEATSRLLGTSREDLMASNDALAQLGPSFDEVIRRSPATLMTEVVVQRADGRAVPCEVRRQAILSRDCWIVVSTFRDISQRRRAEEDIRLKVAELTRSNQELEQFAYVTSHDLSEPLRMVASYTQLLERRYSANFDDDAREFMGYIVGGAQRMKQLIDDLLMYSRAGRPNVQMKEFALDRALDDALANLAHVITATGARIERHALPTIVGDRSGMVQVFQNLVGNAIKFRAENAPPAVHVTAEGTSAEWIISVRDNGIGIAPEYFERIFVIFQRLHPRQKYEGTGIGLAICKKVVDRHGGSVAVESRPGAGATFRIRLPKAAFQQ